MDGGAKKKKKRKKNERLDRIVSVLLLPLKSVDRKEKKKTGLVALSPLFSPLFSPLEKTTTGTTVYAIPAYTTFFPFTNAKKKKGSLQGLIKQLFVVYRCCC